MAERDYTPYQRRAIRNYYRNESAMKTQRLQEVVTEIYLATTEKKKASLWERAAKILAEVGVPAAEADPVVARRDVEALARIAAAHA